MSDGKLWLLLFLFIASISYLLTVMDQNFSEESAIKTQIHCKCVERWQVYQRLLELQVPCYCRCNHPLEVELATPLKLWQFWTVMWRVSASRDTLCDYLHECWQLPAYKKNYQKS
jgi:hypothetical protein